MNRNVLAFAALVAVALFVPAAQAGYLCEDEDGDIALCLKRIPYTSFIPRTLPTEAPSAERKADKRVDDAVETPRTQPKPADADVKLVEKPATVRLPDIPRVCKKYVPSVGEMLPIPCDE